LQPALAKFISTNLAKAGSQKPLLIRRLKATAIDVMTLAKCSIELLNDAVSDTTKDDSSTAAKYIIVQRLRTY
jgi:hypothetical protein